MEEWPAYLWKSAEGPHPKDRAFSGAHVPSHPQAKETQAAGASGSGEVQARSRTGRGGAGQTEAISKKDPSSGRWRGGVNQRDSESDARAR